jgi:Domain of unknown function (DUF4184)
MPFTLAHPAAVLPFRRFCPQFFSFPALVIGSLCPDIGYCFGTLNADDFSHSLNGSIEFCLPIGVVLLGFFYGLRHPIIEMLPERHRKNLRPFCQKPVGSPLIVIVSLLVGIWIHLLLDSFTHRHGWLVESLPLLQTPVFSAGVHVFRIFNLLWYACSFAGIVWLWLAWEHWQNNQTRPVPQVASRGKLRRSFLAGVLMVPIELTHHLIPGPAGLFLTAGYSALIVIVIVLRKRNKDLANH